MRDVLAHPRTLPLLVAGAFFMEFLDGTVIATALPAMAADFKLRPVDLSVGMSAYLITLAILLPASGWASERFGARRVFCTAIATFTFASACCGASRGVLTFTAARVLQGAGGALMVPVGRLAVLRTTPKSELMAVMAVLTWPALSAPILGPPLGGLITTYASWRWVFFINLPLGLLGLILAMRVVPRGGGDTALRLDIGGLVLTGLAILGLLASVEALGRQVVPWPSVVALAAAGSGLALLALRHLARHPNPILNLAGLKVRSFAIVAGGGTLYRIAMGAIPFLLPLMFQVGFGMDAFHSGLLVLALFIGNMAIKPATTFILRSFGFRLTLIFDGVLAALAIMSLALLTPASPAALTAAVLVVAGATRSVGLTALNTLAFAEVPSEALGGANTLFNMLQQIGFGVGIGAGAVALRCAEVWRPTGASHATPLEFRIAYGLIGLLALAGVADFLRLPASAGAQVTRR